MVGKPSPEENWALTRHFEQWLNSGGSDAPSRTRKPLLDAMAKLPRHVWVKLVRRRNRAVIASRSKWR